MRIVKLVGLWAEGMSRTEDLTAGWSREQQPPVGRKAEGRRATPAVSSAGMTAASLALILIGHTALLGRLHQAACAALRQRWEIPQ